VVFVLIIFFEEFKMDQKLKSVGSLKPSYLVAALILIVTSISTAQASLITYNVTGIFYEPQTQPLDTTFNGQFDWDGTTVSNLHGTMNSSMYATDNENPINGLSYPLMNLDYQLAQSVDGNIVTATVFKENTIDVFTGGGYETTVYDAYRYGVFDGLSANDNAYFTLVFDKTTMEGVVDGIVYADCTPGGMMGPTCMTGHNIYPYGTMAAYPSSLTISAVPVPAAVWLFGSALLGMIGVSRKRTLSV